MMNARRLLAVSVTCFLGVPVASAHAADEGRGVVPAAGTTLTWIKKAPPPGSLSAPVGDGHGHVVMFKYDPTGVGLQAFVYSPASNTWTAKAIGLYPSSGGYVGGEAATLALDGRIIVLGGSDSNDEVTATVAAYDPAADKWSLLTPMPIPRQNAVAVTGPGGKIYAIGGATGGSSGGEGEKTLTSVEAFSPRLNQWQEISSLNHRRQNAGAAAGVDGHIYVIGGLYQNLNNVPVYRYANTAEVLDPGTATNRWTVLTMPKIGINSGVEGIDGRIYVNGVGAYDPLKRTWTPFTASPDGPWLVAPGGSCHGYIYGLSFFPSAMDRAALKPTC